MAKLAALPVYWLSTYAVLVVIYFVGCLLVVRSNDRTELGLEIRPKAEEPGLVEREIRQSLRSLLTIAGFVGGGMWAQSEGLTLFTPISLQWWSALPLLLASMVVFDAWFYWGHRLIHTKRFYRRVHAWHHRTRFPVAWSNNSDTFLDNLVLQSYFLFAMALPVPAVVVIVHKLIDQVAGIVGHSGVEHSPGPLSRAPWPLPGVTFHDQHHTDLRYNYGTHFTYWDRLMNTVHPDYEDRMKQFGEAAASDA